MTKPIYTLSKSSRKDKKWMVETPEGKVVHFGAAGYEDFTIHKNLARKNSYIVRHQMNENWNDLNTAGAWARWLLWSEPTLEKSIKKMQSKFDIKIIRNI